MIFASVLHTNLWALFDIIKRTYSNLGSYLIATSSLNFLRDSSSRCCPLFCIYSPKTGATTQISYPKQ